MKRDLEMLISIPKEMESDIRLFTVLNGGKIVNQRECEKKEEVETPNSRKSSISQIAYELYKQDWVNTHTNSEMRLDALRNYAGSGSNESFTDWLFEFGYCGSIYSCFDEFNRCEYQDEEYMESLLKSKELILLYEDEMKKCKEK